MKPGYLIHTILFLLLAPSLWAGHPDLDLYYSQLQKNRSDANIARLRHLMQTVPFDSLITEYLHRGHAVALDTVSVFSYFNDGPVIPTKEERLQKLDQIYAAARRHNSKRLRATADYFKADMMEGSAGEALNARIEACEKALSQARKAGEPFVELLALREIHHLTQINVRYDQMFAYAQRWEETLDNAADDIPWKGRYYIELARSYYHSGDVDRALPMLYKALRIGGEYQMENVTAWNYLAVYHFKHNNLDSAAWYNRTIIASREALNNRSVHLGIAITNLGRVEMARGNYSVAIPMLEAGIPCMQQYNDFNFVVGIYISLGEAWLGYGNLARAKDYIDSVYAERPKYKLHFNENDDVAWLQRATGLFKLESSYYTHRGNHQLARQYLDSMLVASERYQQYVGRHNILLGQQRLQAAEIELKSAEVARQRIIILSVIAALTLITIALLVIVRLYRKRNAAYRKLAQKASEWASAADHTTHPGETTVTTIFGNEPPTEDDLRIMALAETEMKQNHPYREARYTAEALADSIGVHRNYLARAIKRTTGGNFSTYTNGYRVKEAIRIISTTSRRELYIEQLSERVGFGNRNTFTRAFKQFTGISPIEFQKQEEERKRS